MKKTPVVLSFVVATIMALAGGAAQAQGQGTAGGISTTGGAGIGVGVSQFVNGFTGAQVVFDTAKWHLEGQTAFNTFQTGPNNNRTRVTQFDFGVLGWYHLSIGTNSDFSLGGGFAIQTQSGGGSAVQWIVEPGAQIRAFVTPNVAVHAMIAFPLIFGDDNVAGVGTSGVPTSFGLNGQVLAGFGFTYFFR